jgi:hypothetical protein
MNITTKYLMSLTRGAEFTMPDHGAARRQSGYERKGLSQPSAALLGGEDENRWDVVIVTHYHP